LSTLLQADRAAQSRRHVTAAWLILPLLLGGAVVLLFRAGSAHSHRYWRRSSDGGSRSPLQKYLAKEAQQAANATNAAQNNDGNALLGQAPCSPVMAPKPPDRFCIAVCHISPMVGASSFCKGGLCKGMRAGHPSAMTRASKLTRC